MSELDRDAVEMLYEDEGAYWAGEEVITRNPAGEGWSSRLLSLDVWQREVEVGRSLGGPGTGSRGLTGHSESGVGGALLARFCSLETWQQDVEVGSSRPLATGLAQRPDRDGGCVSVA